MAEQPTRLSAEISRAQAGVMPTIELVEQPMPVGVIESTACFAVLAGGRRLAREQRSRPGAVVRLQAQFVIRIVRCQLLQPSRQSATVGDVGHPISGLPKPIGRRELLA